jgi:ABC-type dipeptide/oligopeptide/nickel transport system permease subunit
VPTMPPGWPKVELLLVNSAGIGRLTHGLGSVRLSWHQFRARMPENSGFIRTCLRALAGNRLAGSGALILVTFVLLCLAAPALTRLHVLRAPDEQEAKGLNEDGLPLPAGGAYLLGTDHLGRDVLSRVVYGARVSLSVGIAAMLTATVIGVSIGLLAGFYGGTVDVLLMRFTEMNMTIPAILLAIAFAGLLDVSGRTIHLHPAGLRWHFLDVTLKRGAVSVFLIIGLVCWPGLVRVVRAQVLALKEREFVQAARALGASDARILLRTILPNLLPTVIVLAVMSTANTILLEAGLGYLGIGVPPPAPTWGSMISEGQPYFITFPHLVIVPGLAIVLTVLAFNLLGQGLLEVVDPKARR